MREDNLYYFCMAIGLYTGADREFQRLLCNLHVINLAF